MEVVERNLRENRSITQPLSKHGRLVPDRFNLARPTRLEPRPFASHKVERKIDGALAILHGFKVGAVSTDPRLIYRRTILESEKLHDAQDCHPEVAEHLLERPIGVGFSNPPKPLRIGVLWEEFLLDRQVERNQGIQ